jgi:hypothetical protein
MERDEKKWCLTMAVNIVQAYAGNDSQKGRLDDILDSVYKKIKELHEDVSSSRDRS